MTKTILIDSAHKEETRVALLENGILQDFDREALAIKQIKGNIYLAKVTRVEASLQAAFVSYGSDRHGFLPFSDIHPEYYNLPESEKEKIRELAFPKSNEEEIEDSSNLASANSNSNQNSDLPADENSITVGSYSLEDETEIKQSFASSNLNTLYKKYNIQDVIKPGQKILVQVLKEERGNKGASMTSYISLAGKYIVLMSNTPNKGGISKKVDNFRDRKNLRMILDDLNVPNDRSVIIRTAGVGKKPEEIKRDYDYLIKLWDNITKIASTSDAPCFVHAEDDIIKRCIRDVYNETIDEVIVEGKDGYESVLNFVKLTTPESSSNIKLHDERVPIFNKYRVEQQISSLYEKQIALPSGGSIVIDHTEALVAIDVNSGKATRENAVENTALNTNLEAAKEIARQLRLRDLSGLIVIDFIDMYDQKNRRTVERTLRDSMQHDRARIQLGRISVFGLMEMSRQRLGSSFFETITDPCRHCNGTGYVRSVEIVAVSILRSIRHTCADKQAGAIHVYSSNEVVAYVLNYKKHEIISTEKSYNVHIFMHYSDDLGIDGFFIKKRKGLSDEEKRELDMEVITGKVNQLGIERDFLDEVGDMDFEASPNNGGEKQYRGDNHHRKLKNKNRYNRDHNRTGRRNEQNRHDRNGGEDKSLLKKIFKIFDKD